VVHALRARLAYLTDRYQREVTLIGCSLGGIYARQLARRTPQAVRQVITLGSPIRLVRHEQSRAHRLFHRDAHEHIEPLDLPLERGKGPFRSRQRRSTPRSMGSSPGGPAWTSRRLARRNIAVLASHLGIANHPAALWVIADRLAQPADQWKPFQPPSLLRSAYLTPGS
jgi:pimeloyl-ACP methyl ester carboxylesterase